VRIRVLAAAFSLLLLTSAVAGAGEKLSALIIEGQNNHGVWPTTTKMMKGYLEQTGMFTVDVATTKPRGVDPDFKPEFKKYDVVLTNYNGSPWPEATQKSFVDYVQGGGGLVVVHAANNSFGNWKEYNQMIGLGGWGGRNEKSGPYVYVGKDGKVVRDTSAGRGGHHGPQHPFSIIVRNPDHPVTRGMPREWLHAKDELYDFLRGPAENMTILATAFANKDKYKGSGRHEPMLMTLNYGKGRVFHTPMGHGIDSQECVGFIVSVQRGAEWAATGKVTQKIPQDFPGPGELSSRKYKP